jgi:hypothetical protein
MLRRPGKGDKLLTAHGSDQAVAGPEHRGAGLVRKGKSEVPREVVIDAPLQPVIGVATRGIGPKALQQLPLAVREQAQGMRCAPSMTAISPLVPVTTCSASTF